MGEVYRATDTSLGRQVAIKVLPASVASDAERLARFDREARTLASLNHPNIATIHGLERSDGMTALVMELVEGPTLADRIAEGPIPVDEVLPIAMQIAEALEAAHERGVIHRDLKPANVKVRPDGAVKVLDFGLARAVEPAGASSPGLTQSPTITTPAMTQAGLILGTAAYMSPEQARGKPVDRRADIWAFGCVLYEMLTGRRAFPGDDVTDTLAAVVKLDPAWDAIPADVPARVRQVVRVCLQKDPKQRAADIHDVHLALAGAFDAVDPHSTAVVPSLRLLQRPLPALGAAALLVVLTALTVWTLAPRDVRRPARLVVSTPAAAPLSLSAQRDLAVLPDGTGVVYRARGQDGLHLMVRPLDRLDGTSLFRTDAGFGNPFVSPAGDWVGFATLEDQTWKRVSMRGGAAQTLFPTTSAPRGASWGPDGTIVFAMATPGTGLFRGPAAGGEPSVLTTPDAAQGELNHWWPEILPGGGAVLFTVRRGAGADMSIAVLDLASGEKTVLLPGSNPRYVPTEHILYGVDGTLWAAPFDRARLELTGDAVPVLEGVMMDATGAVEFDLSADGSLVYVPAEGAPGTRTGTLVWRRRDGGGVEPFGSEPLEYPRYLRLSPNGRRLALTTGPGDQGALWVYDLGGRPPTPLTFEGHNIYPVWHPEGTRVAFASDRDGGISNLFWIPADGSTLEPESLLMSVNPQLPSAWTSDGRELIVEERRSAETSSDILAVPLEGAPEPRVVVATQYFEGDARLSPDGQWLAYVSDVTGRDEVWIRPYPGPGAPTRVSPDGGIEPVWAPDGRELFYLTGDDASPRLLGVTIETAPALDVGAPQVVIDGGFVVPPNAGGAYDVAPDGRFVMIGAAPEAEADTGAENADIVLVQHFFEELKRLVPSD